MTLKKCEGFDGLYKDDASGVIHNKSDNERTKYQQMKRQATLNISAQTEIAELKSDIDELKTLLYKLTQNNGS